MQRLKNLYNQFISAPTQVVVGERLRLYDNRTKKIYEIQVKESKDCYYIKSKDLAQIVNRNSQPLRIYDPGYVNTICNTSKISYIDGKKGILEFRGYRIEELAAQSSFLEVAFLLIYGELPSTDQLTLFSDKVMNHTIINTGISELLKNFTYDSNPMSILISTVSALSTLKYDPKSSKIGHQTTSTLQFRNKQIFRLLGIVPTIAANSYRHINGMAQILPQKNLGYAQNFLYMLDASNEIMYKSHPKLIKALDVLFILHAEHQMSCSTAFVRHMASSGVDIYTTIAMAAGALYGPKHGGANAAVIKMLESIEKKENVRKFLMQVKLRKKTLFGFGHRIYKNYDPRAKIVQKIALDVFEICGKQPLIEIALELQRTALQDDYFITRKLYPNMDFYSGLIFRAMGFTTEMFPVLYTIPRVAGWLAHWMQFLNDSQNNIYRPRQNYIGYGKRQFIEMSERTQHFHDIQYQKSNHRKRRDATSKYNQENKS